MLGTSLSKPIKTAHILQGLWNSVLIASSDPFYGTSLGLSLPAGKMKMEMEAVGLNGDIDGQHLAPCVARYKLNYYVYLPPSTSVLPAPVCLLAFVLTPSLRSRHYVRGGPLSTIGLALSLATSTRSLSDVGNQPRPRQTPWPLEGEGCFLPPNCLP